MEPERELVADGLETIPRRREIERPEAGAELGLEPLGELVGEVHRVRVPGELVAGGREDRCGGAHSPRAPNHRALDSTGFIVSLEGEALVLNRTPLRHRAAGQRHHPHQRLRSPPMRRALVNANRINSSGTVEVDGTYVGGYQGGIKATASARAVRRR